MKKIISTIFISTNNKEMKNFILLFENYLT